MKTISHYRQRIKFTKKMKRDYTILSPSMAPIHFQLLRPVFQRQGFHVDIMENEGPEVLQLALKYLHNDLCYPAMLTTGQMLATMKSGKYDPDKVAMVITQSGGGCRDRYLNELTKQYTGKVVTAGPVEATATGNLMSQLIYIDKDLDLAKARQMIINSFDIKEFNSVLVGGTV